MKPEVSAWCDGNVMVFQKIVTELAGILDDGLAMTSLLCGPALYYPPLGYADRLRGVEEITAAGIQAAARTIFRPERLAVAVVGPLSRARQGEVRELVTSWR